jgi:Tol biopolymer transport system component
MRITIAILAFILACQPTGTVQCKDDASCNAGVGGVCLGNPTTGNKWCTYPDSNCASGTRWSDHDVGDGVGGLCVNVESLSDGGTPDGNSNSDCMPRIAFYDGPFDFSQSIAKREVYVSNLDGTGLVNVSNSAAFDDYNVTWAPDGVRLAFQSNRAGNWDIFVVRADGSGLRNLTSGNSAQEEAPVWSPDGLKIAYTVNNTPWVMTLDGLAPAQASSLTVSSSIAWSPDSKKILFGHVNPNFPDLFVANIVSGSEPSNMTNSQTQAEGGGNWAPNAKVIFYVDGDIFTADSTGSAKQNITMSSEYDYEPKWSNTGNIYFSSERGGGRPEVWKTSGTGGIPVQITNNALTEVGQGDFVRDVSKNEQKVAFTRYLTDSTSRVGVVNSDGTDEVIFSAGSNNAREPVFAKCP